MNIDTTTIDYKGHDLYICEDVLTAYYMDGHVSPDELREDFAKYNQSCFGDEQSDYCRFTTEPKHCFVMVKPETEDGNSEVVFSDSPADGYSPCTHAEATDEHD